MASERGERDPAGAANGAPGMTLCLFCRVVRGDLPAHVVYEDALTVAFLDHRPLFPGHALVVPRAHVETLLDLPSAAVAPLFAAVQVLARAVERGLGAAGSFVAVNNRVSQSVPHLHVHVVPRRPKDGLKGFFWPRGRYRDEAEAADIAARLRAAVADVGGDGARA
jgi:histidine triad (HIT) family protein